MSTFRRGASDTRLYKIWSNMKSRCYNKNRSNYKYYGGKGIKICDEWLSAFVVFHDWAINNGYQENLTIDRNWPIEQAFEVEVIK